MTSHPLPSAAIALACSMLLSGCLVRTAADVVTAPVRVVSKGVDWATTSQSEADEKRGRELRRREERQGKLDREYRRHRDQCARGDEDACDRARDDYAALEDLRGQPY